MNDFICALCAVVTPFIQRGAVKTFPISLVDDEIFEPWLVLSGRNAADLGAVDGVWKWQFQSEQRERSRRRFTLFSHCDISILIQPLSFSPSLSVTSSLHCPFLRYFLRSAPLLSFPASYSYLYKDRWGAEEMKEPSSNTSTHAPLSWPKSQNI